MVNGINNLRIFVGPHEVAGYYKNLSAGFAMLGVSYDYVTYGQHAFCYGGETKRPLLLSLANWFDQFRGKAKRNKLLKGIVALPPVLLQASWALIAVFRYDVFIFGYGYSLVRGNYDLPLLKLLGKTVIVNVGHGAELRPPYIDGAHQAPDGQRQPTSEYLFLAAQERTKRIRFLEKYATYILGAPFSSTQYSSRKLVNLFALGVPYHQLIEEDSSDSQNNRDSRWTNVRGLPNDSVCILHSPSHPAAKGTLRIKTAIESLKAKGYSIEFVELVGRPNEEVIAAIRRCDFVVDQVYSDTPMAGFATEAAWFGKPAVVGGYGFEYLKCFIPEGMYPPSKTCHPDRLESAIEELIADKSKRVDLGVQAQEFVRTRWAATAVAGRYLRLIAGDAPEEWWLDPAHVVYTHGGGQPEKQTKINIQNLVTAYGVSALHLSHRPGLEKAFLQFAGINQQ